MPTLARPLDHGSHYLANAALKLAVIGDRAADRDFASKVRMNAAADQLRGIDQQASRYAFFEAVTLQVANLLADQNQIASRLLVDVAFVYQNVSFEWCWRVIELEPDESLPGRLFQILEDALITGVVRDDQHEFMGRLQNRSAFFDRQYAAIVRQRVNQDYRVFAGFDHFVKVTNSTVFDRRAERPIVPDCFVAFEEEAAHKIGRGQVFVARDGDKGTVQTPGHVLDEPSLAAARRPFQHNRKFPTIGRFK